MNTRQKATALKASVLLFLFGQSTMIYSMLVWIFFIKLPLISRLPLCFVRFSASDGSQLQGDGFIAFVPKEARRAVEWVF